ncbi:MAG TPA: hypothetical protein VGO03_13565 [Acidimicrobiia bacterium]
MPGGRQLTAPEIDLVAPSAAARRRSARACRHKFLEFFPDGFRDPTYIDTERGYKWQAHRRWRTEIAPVLQSRRPLSGELCLDIARQVVRIEATTNLLFSFEKMALRDALADPIGAQSFIAGLRAWLGSERLVPERFAVWCQTLDSLPRRQTRVATWPVATVFGFLAKPRTHMFLKPNVMRHAARAYSYPLHYTSRPNSTTYASLLDFAATVRRDLHDLRPRDMIDTQSFLWVQGSDEYS